MSKTYPSDFNDPTIWEKVPIKDWSHFETECEKLQAPADRQFIFRGQSSSEYNLTTSLLRSFDSNSNVELEAYEDSMILEFEKFYYHHTNIRFPKPKTKIFPDIREYKLNLLSVMQHYGAPTRLQDWTYSPYIALFFAMDGANKDTPFCVYALDINLIEMLYYIKYEEAFKANYSDSPFKDLKDFTFDDVDGHIPFVYHWEPSLANERLRVQQGLFLVPSVAGVSITWILSRLKEELPHISTIGKKFIFNPDQMSSLWKKMNFLNLTHESIYPGMEGFCKALKISQYDNHRVEKVLSNRHDDPVLQWILERHTK
ncbi:FRG domain-containing protein [Mesobacillus foraminis]|uniref:FRG domain-containing protein n=1 Tax=Mesobacillus foraminis TaxID=279826 RepID=A0A4R2B0E0_9BACI|nr:FRG domain-containing protein [Mesobacillus foraminis]TCN18934.1 FRG domain-containing protein [Mesobacillus foraminis]